MSKPRTSMIVSFPIACTLAAAVAGSGCSHVNMKQVAYEMLSQEDCRRNHLDDFCTRSFHKEYHEYEQIRQEYLRDQREPTGWRVSAQNDQ